LGIIGCCNGFGDEDPQFQALAPRVPNTVDAIGAEDVPELRTTGAVEVTVTAGAFDDTDATGAFDDTDATGAMDGTTTAGNDEGLLVPE